MRPKCSYKSCLFAQSLRLRLLFPCGARPWACWNKEHYNDNATTDAGPRSTSDRPCQHRAQILIRTTRRVGSWRWASANKSSSGYHVYSNYKGRCIQCIDCQRCASSSDEEDCWVVDASDGFVNKLSNLRPSFDSPVQLRDRRLGEHPGNDLLPFPSCCSPPLMPPGSIQFITRKAKRFIVTEPHHEHHHRLLCTPALALGLWITAAVVGKMARSLSQRGGRGGEGTRNQRSAINKLGAPFTRQDHNDEANVKAWRRGRVDDDDIRRVMII